MKIAITGHRPSKLRNDYDLKSDYVLRIKREIVNILSENDLDKMILISGMALGIDQLFTEIAIENNIPFKAYIPCLGQASVWTEKTREKWKNMLEQAEEVVNTSGKINYEPHMMQMRNERMVNDCDMIIAVWDGTSGGTKNCIDYAVKKNKRIIYIMLDDKDGINVIKEKSLFQ
jgi:uncharacterized phage-like protein YoqJ